MWSWFLAASLGASPVLYVVVEANPDKPVIATGESRVTWLTLAGMPLREYATQREGRLKGPAGPVIRTVLRATLSGGDTMECLWSEKKIFEKRGEAFELAARYVTELDPAKNRLTIQEERPIGSPVNTSRHSVKRPLILAPTFPMVMEEFLKAQPQTWRVQGLVNPSTAGFQLYEMEIKKHGETTLRAEGRDRKAQKITLHPDVGLFSGLAPSSVFWFESSAPFRFLAYQGLESGLGTPQVIIRPTPAP